MGFGSGSGSGLDSKPQHLTATGANQQPYSQGFQTFKIEASCFGSRKPEVQTLSPRPEFSNNNNRLFRPPCFVGCCNYGLEWHFMGFSGHVASPISSLNDNI